MKDESDELGQLPTADRNAELQRRSIVAFRASLPADKFVFRDERTEDAGVDGSLELLIGSSQTNLRSQVQLKSTDSDSSNEDGSVSVPVKASNLNYLLNGPSPLYILYIAERNEIRFAWARDERKRLDSINQDWQRQQNVSIRFHSVLTPEAIDQIHQRIRQEAQFQRQINNILDAASSTEPLVVSIAPETLKVTDPIKAKQILLRSGTAIASAGYVNEVRNLIKLLSPEDAHEPRILLVQAHAEHILGRYHLVGAILADISLHFDELSEDDQQFFRMLQDICEFQTGKIDIHEFKQRSEKLFEGTDTRFATSNRVTQLRYAVLTERDLDSRTAILEDFRLLVTDIINDAESSNAFKIYARVNLLEAEGYLITLDAVREIGEARLRLAVGVMPDLTAMLTEQSKEFEDWEQTSVGVLTDALSVGNPILIASAMVIRGSIATSFLTNKRVFRLMFDLPDIEFGEDAIQGIIDSAKQAIEAFSQAGNLEGELRAKMLMADGYELIGDTESAKTVASEVLPMAQAIEYASLISRASEHLAGEGLQNKIRKTHRRASEEERVLGNAQITDEEIAQNASRMLRLLELPAERLPILEREYISHRDIANEQLSWCRYLELIQDKRHELHASTRYRTDPQRYCRCELHGYVSKFGNSDWKAVISAFKRAYCDQCPDRTPLQ
jgi:hypothetical protein